MSSSDRALPRGADLYCLGGGEDGPQVQSAELLGDGTLHRAVEAGAVVLAVCAGYQVVGQSFPDAEGISRPGAGLIDVSTVKGHFKRSVGEILAEPLAFGEPSEVARLGSLHADLGAGALNGGAVERSPRPRACHRLREPRRRDAARPRRAASGEGAGRYRQRHR